MGKAEKNVMSDILGKSIGIIILHVVGLLIFSLIWIFILKPMYSLPELDTRQIVTAYLILDFMFFLLAKFDN